MPQSLQPPCSPGQLSVWAAKLLSAVLPELPTNGSGKSSMHKANPLGALSQSYSVSDAQGCCRLSCALCVWQDLGQGTGRDELTHAEHHQSSSKVISITGAHLLHESHPIHHCYCLDVTLPARAWPLSPKSPWCAMQQLHPAGPGSMLLPHSLPPSSLLRSCGSCSLSPLWLHSPG